MADDVVVYWVPKNGVMYAASLVTRTFVGISSPERLEASRRALDFAGVPNKDWPHGEPSTMEEFGTEVRSANAADWLLYQIEAVAQLGRAAAQESQRMLGVLLGYGGHQNNELAHEQLLKATALQVVVQTDGDGAGAWYAIGPKTFFHLVTFDEVNALRDAGVLSRNAWNHTEARIKEMRRLVLQDNTGLWDPKASAPKVKTLVATGTVIAPDVALPEPEIPKLPPAVEPIEPYFGPVDPKIPELPNTGTEAVALAEQASQG